MNLTHIDNQNEFDFGRTSENYARYRDIYPQSMYDRLVGMGIGKEGQHILDLGSGIAVLPNSSAALEDEKKSSQKSAENK